MLERRGDTGRLFASRNVSMYHPGIGHVTERIEIECGSAGAEDHSN